MIKYLLLSASLVFSVSTASAQFDEMLAKGVNDVYGERCGIAGTAPEARVQLENWIKDNESDEIRNWLTSPNKALQAYAVEGLIRLSNNKEITLTDEELSEIKRLKESSVVLPTCQGCVHRELTFRAALRGVKLKK